MTQLKTRTQKAAETARRAHCERKMHPGVLPDEPTLALAEMTRVDRPPTIGTGGELIEQPEGPLSPRRTVIRETLTKRPTVVAEDASLTRTDLLLQPSFNAVAMGLDAAQSIKAANSMEKMLAHQMAVSHEAAMRLLNRALSYEAEHRHLAPGHSVEACRLANTSARLMSVFQDGLLTLQRLRSGGSQTVTVQHVNVVQPGAQAVIGSVKTGGRARSIRGTK